MAGNTQLKNSVFDSEIVEKAKSLLRPPLKEPLGDAHEAVAWTGLQVSRFLCKSLEEKLAKNPLWLECHPVLLGSWARYELCIKSDLDVLFLGEEEKIKAFTQDCFQKGIKLRARIPQDLNDWTVNVETADVLALFHGRALTEKGVVLLKEQKDKIFSNKKITEKLLKDTLQDKAQRAERYDSIFSFLEPHLKNGAGGLRDLYQGKVFRQIYGHKFVETNYEKLVLDYYLDFFVTVRHKLHFDGQGDILIGPEQHSLSAWFGYSTHKEFMRQIERGIARVSFYSDWILERSKASPAKLKQTSKIKTKTAADLLKGLQKDQSVLSQYEIRRALDPIFEPEKKVSASIRGQLLAKVLDVKEKDSVIHAVFRSRLIDKLCPRLTRLVGYVQHDQYHRFTADAHILQACREMKRLYKKPKELAELSKFTKDLKKKDWDILSWSALYHDLAKGVDSEDHSDLGEKWVKEDFKKFKVSAEVSKEVSWIVKNHLELSKAAFRKNPFARSTWQDLYDLGLNKERLIRLAIFTAADIRATNPEAWNSWKSRLLAQLVQVLLDGKTQNYLEAFKKISPKIKPEWLEIIDPEIFSSLPNKVLLKDLENLASKKQTSIKVFQDKNKRTWIRFYEPEDRKGLLFDYVQKLFGLGLQNQHALIHTLPDLGVYDWFQVTNAKNAQQIEKFLSLELKTIPQLKQVTFQSIDFISSSDQEWVISFKALDQKGLLLSAVRALTAKNAEIISARVHTWGRQVDDLFSIKPLKTKPQDFVSELEKELGVGR